jgi:TolB-like protein/Tfp pilus assembly protein PilF
MAEAGSPGGPPAAERLDSWKEIATHLGRSVRTVQRWERMEGLPVHRHLHARHGTVYALRREVDAWWLERGSRLDAEPETSGQDEPVEDLRTPLPLSRRTRRQLLVAGAVTAAAAIGAAWLASRSRGPSPMTLAVLPFEDLSEGGDADYLANGVTEELIGVLARLAPDRLRVVARTSVAPYKAHPKPIRNVARDLGADFVMEGAVHLSGTRLRITARLVEVREETPMWSEAYEREIGDLLRAEIEMAEAIARRLSIQLLRRPARPRAVSAEARISHLQGIHFWNRRDEASIRRAVELFRSALEREPDYAQARAGLAAAYASLATSASALPADEAQRLAEAEARRALTLDPELPEAHLVLATLACRFDWGRDGCHAALKRTLEMDPNRAPARHLLGEHLIQRGDFDEAVLELERARLLDPLSASIHAHLGIAHMYANRYAQALARFSEASDLDPRYLLAWRLRGLTLVRSGRVEEGLEALRSARRLDPESPRAAADLAHALGRAGRTAEARSILAELEDLGRRRMVSPYDFAVVHAGLGDESAALAWLERAYAERATGVRWLGVETMFEGLRGHPRFERLVQGLARTGDRRDPGIEGSRSDPRDR